MSDEERDTLPPSQDPLMAIAERLEHKLDRLTRIATLCFNKLQDHDIRLDGLNDRVAAVESIPPHPPGNGSVIPDAE